MKHIKQYESIYNKSNYLSIREGDTVVYVDINASKKPILKTGEKYIVHKLYDKFLTPITSIDVKNVDAENDDFYLSVKNMK